MKTVLAGARLRHLREERGLSQAALAQQLEISASYLNQIEHDKRPLTVPVLLRITEAFGIDAEFFSTQDTARLVAELRDALLDEAIGVDVSDGEVAELAAAMPSVARALISLRRRYRDTVERTTAQLGGQGTAADALPATMPHEEVRDFFYDRKNYIGPLDEAAERVNSELDLRPGDARVPLVRRLRDRHDVRVVGRPADAPAGELRRYDPEARVLRLSEQLRPGQQAFQLATQLAFLEHDELLDDLVADARLSGPEAQGLTRIGLAHYYAAAVLMPYRPFRATAEEFHYDVERLADHFRVGFEVVCHRLSTLQRPRLAGVPFSFVRVDRAGNMSKRQSATGFHFSRGGGTCPLWAVYEAFTTPGRILTQVARMPDGRDYFWIARTVARRRTGYGMPTKTFALGLGCELRHAHRLVYSRGLDLADRSSATKIGMGCKTCEWTDCPQRAFPSLGRSLAVDERRSTFVPYPSDERQAESAG
ncbi:MAG TPA: short-chain fatty acyl-CoA regulator family protein [Solirubrobacterales bacterium]|nr:short-chain fatty acyl-CoA regulator family protein [Solirubrobacterales bacterium]